MSWYSFDRVLGRVPQIPIESVKLCPEILNGLSSLRPAKCAKDIFHCLGTSGTAVLKLVLCVEGCWPLLAKWGYRIAAWTFKYYIAGDPS